MVLLPARSVWKNTCLRKRFCLRGQWGYSFTVSNVGFPSVVVFTQKEVKDMVTALME